MQNSFINFYLGRILLVENNTNVVQQKVVFPDNTITLMFQFGETIFENNCGRKLPVPLFAFCGQLTKSKEFLCPPASKAILVKFKPWTARFFFNCELHKLIDQVIPLINFINEDMTIQIIEQFSLVQDKRKFIVDFLQKKFNYISIDNAILQAIDIINKSKGKIKVDELACKVFNSKRNFERKFKALIGLSPKKFIMNIRFQNSLHFLNENNELNDIAYDCAYCDQSHFSNEIKKITGITANNISSQLCRISPIKSIFIPSSLQYKILLAE
ncbi:MAG: helix-turn-helix transcriptional regulator [Bacteroidota bacterium]|nr:helix-turn-helix transcriptional regulator [Bacteroidota bacterium]